MALLRRGNTDLESSTLCLRAQTEIRLTGSEAILLRALFVSPGTVQRKVLHDLLCLGRNGGGPDTKTIDILMMRLRRKLLAVGSEIAIVNVRAVGFRIEGGDIERLVFIPLALLQRACEGMPVGSEVCAELTAALHAAGDLGARGARV